MTILFLYEQFFFYLVIIFLIINNMQQQYHICTGAQHLLDTSQTAQPSRKPVFVHRAVISLSLICHFNEVFSAILFGVCLSNVHILIRQKPMYCVCSENYRKLNCNAFTDGIVLSVWWCIVGSPANGLADAWGDDSVRVLNPRVFFCIL